MHSMLSEFHGIVPELMPKLGVGPVHHLEALNFVISSDKISVLNSPSNVDSEYV